MLLNDGRTNCNDLTKASCRLTYDVMACPITSQCDYQRHDKNKEDCKWLDTMSLNTAC